EKRRGSQLVEAAGADFVKTSTGFAPSGATIPDLILMRESVSPRVQVKAAGGVRTLDGLLEVMSVGVTRIGATRTAEILDDYRARTAGADRGASAAPTAPAIGPNSAATIWISSAGTRVTRERTWRRIGSRAASPAAMMPPPMTIRSGPTVAIMLARPMPSQEATVSMAAALWASPSAAVR